MTMLTTNPPTLGHWLKRLRAQQDLTQEALAELANCSIQTIRFFESGKRRPSITMAEHLAQILHVPADEVASFIKRARTPIAAEDPLATGAIATAAAQPVNPPSALSRPAIQQHTPLLLSANALIGREAEVNILRRLLIDERHRLVSLIGMGGMGKTRLALHLAHLLQPHFTDGAAFVPLASLTRVTEIPAAIARALDKPLPNEPANTNGSPPERSHVEFERGLAQVDLLLQGRTLLLVLDNFEHLINPHPGQAEDSRAVVVDENVARDALALVDHLRHQHPNIQLLITSRDRLRLSGEQSFELVGLTVAQDAPSTTIANNEAVLLFVQRAAQVMPGFALNGENQAAIGWICTMLEGAPLAIELAAAWSHILSPGEIADEITRNLDFLARGDRNAPIRHRSLRSLFDHSWTLLTPEEQAVLVKVATFRGGFTREGAQALANVRLPLMAQLVDKSLIRVFMQPTATGTQMARYYLHSLLRTYLLEKLDERDERATAYRDHAKFFSTLAEQVTVTLYAGNARPGLYQLNEEQANLQAALDWSVTDKHDLALGLQLAGALGRYWQLTGQWREGRNWLVAALAYSTGDDAHLARALGSLGQLQHALEETDSAIIQLQRALMLWRKLDIAPQIAWTLFQLGVASSSQGAYVQANAYLAESLDIYRTLGDRWAIATVLNQLSAVASSRGDYATAGRMLEESLPILRETQGQSGGLAVALNLLGRIVLDQGDAQRSITLFEDALAISTEGASKEGQAWALLNLGLAHLATTDLSAAADVFQAALQLNRELERKGGMMAAKEGLAAVAAGQGHFAEAKALLAAAAELRNESGQLLTIYEQRLHEQTLMAIKQSENGLNRACNQQKENQC